MSAIWAWAEVGMEMRRETEERRRRRVERRGREGMVRVGTMRKFW